MKTRKLLTVIVLVLSTSFTAIGKSIPNESRRARLLELRSAGSRSLTLLERAYLDTAQILDQPGECSQFFGGSKSTRVLDQLVMSLRETSSNDSRTGVRMFGAFTVVVDSDDLVLYRLFPDAELNTAGPFYKAKRFPSELFVPKVGSFSPNTRPARVLILMHELAHLITGPTGTWLIPDDGHAPQLSRQNTATVEGRCARELRALQ